jgi:hypothetical protein
MPSWVSPWKEQPLDLQVECWITGVQYLANIVSECPYHVYYNPGGYPPIYFAEQRLPQYKGEVIGLITVSRNYSSKTTSVRAQLTPLGGKFRVCEPMDKSRAVIVNSQAFFDLGEIVALELKKCKQTRLSFRVSQK